MIKCDDINKKTNEKCSSDAKWKVKINNETEYIHPRCGRHSRNMEKIFIINDIDENKEKKKDRKTKSKMDNEINNITENIENKYVSENLNKKTENKLEILFLKIDELCDLLNKTDINDK